MWRVVLRFSYRFAKSARLTSVRIRTFHSDRVQAAQSAIAAVVAKPQLDERNFVNADFIFGIICLLAAVLLSCVAGVYAVTNTPAAVAIAFTACFVLFVGVKWISDRR